MKSKRNFSFFILVLALTAQLSLVAPSVQAQNSNSSATMMESTPMQAAMPAGRCKRRCNASYRVCLRRGGYPRACRSRYRNCLRRCSR